MENDLKLEKLNKLAKKDDIEDSLRLLADIFPEKAVFTTSFGIEDQLISHFIFKNNIPIRVVTLDTGRLFPETYKVFSDTLRKYGKRIDVYFPDRELVEKLVSDNGPYSFYNSKEERLECCRSRKVVPLKRALAGMDLWISGIRAEQSENRNQMDMLEYDDLRRLYKYYPLFHWSYESVKRFVIENDIPYNVLHNKGFVSIGCQPCTRAVREGSDFRSGRWWWEPDGIKECGCHVH